MNRPPIDREGSFLDGLVQGRMRMEGAATSSAEAWNSIAITASWIMVPASAE